MTGNTKLLNGRLLIFILLSLSISLFSASQSNAFGFYNWYAQTVGRSLAMMDAEDQLSPLILYFYMDPDEWSEKMSNEYLADAQVDDFLLDIPKAAINISYSDVERKLAQEYGVERCPAFLISIPSLETGFHRIHPFSEKHTMSVEEFIGKIKEFITYHYNLRAHSMFEKKEYEKSLELFEKSIKFDPQKPYTYHAIGIIYHTMSADKNDPDLLHMAEENYKKALELDPDNEDIKAELNKLMKDHKKEKQKPFGEKP